LTIATLFLNFSFWYVHGTDVWMFCSLPLYGGLLATGALLIIALFFLGPALATQAARRPLLGVAKNSLGSIPTFGLRLCCILFIVLWIANLVSVPEWLLRFILRRDVYYTETWLIITLVLLFLFITGLQSLQTTAKLALFTTKLGIAILVAALLRVHQGWPAALKPAPISVVWDLWHGLSLLSFYVAPLALLAADGGYRSDGKKQIVRTALMGIALPLAGTLLFVGVINAATLHSRFYTPSLNPNVAMALWGRAARSSLPGVMMLATITIFGAVRFGARALAECVSIASYGTLVRWALLLFLVGAIALVSVQQDSQRLSAVLEVSATCLAVAGAVLSADVLTGRRRVERGQRIDWIGVIALLAGLATPLFMPLLIGWTPESWWHPWLLPSWGMGFLVCLASGTVQKLTNRKAV
jgi:hypothetical protein